MKLPTYQVLRGMRKENLQDELAPYHIRANKAKGALEIAHLETRLEKLKLQLIESVAVDEINFTHVLSVKDDMAWVERKLGQYKEMMGELFPDGI